MNKKYILLALLGTLWGILELQFGSLFHAADLPFIGLVMMSVGIFFQTFGRLITRLRGSALLMAIVASFIKIIFVGGIAALTVFAILVQSLILEYFYSFHKQSALSFSTAGALAVCYSLFHPFITMPLFMGLTVADAYNRTIGAGAALLGLGDENGSQILLILIFVHLSFGFFAGFLSFRIVIKMLTKGWLKTYITKERLFDSN